MQVFSPDDALALTDLLSEQLPEVMLQALCQAGTQGVTQGYLVRTLSQFLPTHFENEELPDRVQAYLRWLLLNGDIANAGSTRYRIMPTYGILLSLGNAQTELRICGDPRRKLEITTALDSLNGIWYESTVNWRVRIQDQFRDLRIGTRRGVKLSAAESGSAISMLSNISVPVVEVEYLSRDLPTVDSVRVPSRDSFVAIPPTFGFWFSYEPTLRKGNRWQREDDWRGETQALLRWQPSEDWRGERASRYFLRNQNDLPAELSESVAHLWMFHLDDQVDRARTVVVNDGTLVVPSHLPDPHRQWLQLFVDRLVWRDTDLHCSLSVATEAITARLVETLHLSIEVRHQS